MTWPSFASATSDAPPRAVVIAELGVNHDGDLGRALRLVAAAAEAGADAVKLQHFDPEQLLSADAQLAEYQRSSAGDARTLLQSLALDLDQARRVGEAAAEAGLALVVTMFSPGSREDLAALGVDAVKIASPDAVNPPLLDAAASLGVPLLISTGTCDLDELEPAADLLRSHTGQGRGSALLQCVSSYPTPPDAAALGGIAALADAFGLPVGYSDHTPDLHTGGLALAAGAVVLEKHLTHDRGAPGPDHATSLDPGQFADYVRAVRQAQAMLGPRAKIVSPLEHDTRRVSRQSLCATADLPAGCVLTPEDLTVKRPGTGIPAAALPQTLGRTLARPVQADHILRPEDLA